MPMIDVKIPHGSLAEPARAQLADRLTATLLKWEKAPDNETFRSITWAFIHEVEVHVGGPNGHKPHFHVLCSVPEGALSERRKAGLVEEATAVVADIAGIGEDFADRLRIWVHIHEVPEGHWGAAGQIFRFMDIVRHANPEAAERMEAKAGSAA